MLKQYLLLKPYLKQHWYRYLLGIIFLFITNAGQMAIPQTIRRSINHISQGNIDTSKILHWMLYMLGFALVVTLGRIAWRHYIQGASRRIERDLRGKVFQHLLQLGREFYGTMKTGDIMARLTNDMHHIRMATGMALVAFMDGLFMTLFILIILFRSYPKLTWLLILPLPLLTLLILLVGPYLGKLFRAVQKGYSGISNSAQETLSGIRLIKSFQREDFALKRFQKQNDKYIQANLGLVRVWGMFNPLIMALSGITSFLLLRYGGEMVLKGTLLPGDFVAIMSYMGMLIWPMMGMGFTINVLQRGAASLERINEILQKQPAITDAPQALETVPRGDLQIDQVEFHYPGSQEQVLKNLSLTIPQGSTLGVLGRTGSGKTTLIELFSRLWEPQQGIISIGGKDIAQYTLEALRASTALVPQDSFLFSETIGYNLRFGNLKAMDKEVQKAMEATTIDRDLKNFPLGTETLVGEKGVTLSGGQKQRICLARALLMDREILILDDALSAVDTRTEEIILEALKTYRKNKTTILISHRYSTLKQADSIIVLEDGRITAQGSHSSLIDQEGFYREIYQLQRLEENS